LIVLIKYLPRESALLRAMNGGQTPWGNVEHLLADLWALTLHLALGKKSQRRDHPTRAERATKVKAAAKLAKAARMRARWQRRR
jgi:hypothetical protein